MKRIVILSSFVVFMCSAVFASPCYLTKAYTGEYRSVAMSKDNGKSWTPFPENIGYFAKSNVKMFDGYLLDYRRVVSSAYNGVEYVFIQLNYDDVIQLTRTNQGMYMIIYLQNGVERERYLCQRRPGT